MEKNVVLIQGSLDIEINHFLSKMKIDKMKE